MQPQQDGRALVRPLADQEKIAKMIQIAIVKVIKKPGNPIVSSEEAGSSMKHTLSNMEWHTFFFG